jgi:hypothetical protein
MVHSGTSRRRRARPCPRRTPCRTGVHTGPRPTRSRPPMRRATCRTGGRTGNEPRRISCSVRSRPCRLRSAAKEPRRRGKDRPSFGKPRSSAPAPARVASSAARRAAKRHRAPSVRTRTHGAASHLPGLPDGRLESQLRDAAGAARAVRSAAIRRLAYRPPRQRSLRASAHRVRTRRGGSGDCSSARPVAPRPVRVRRSTRQGDGSPGATAAIRRAFHSSRGHRRGTSHGKRRRWRARGARLDDVAERSAPGEFGRGTS